MLWFGPGRRGCGRGVLAGYSAAALHGTRYIDASLPANIIDTNKRSERGIIVWADKLTAGDVCAVGEMLMTTPSRTAVDLARKYPEDVAVLDALARSARLTVDDLQAAVERYRGLRGIKRARETIALVDPGAESPRETWLRLLLMRAGFPRPVTQYPILNEYRALIGEVDLAWPDLKVAVEYEGRHHMDPRQARKDIARIEEMVEVKWAVVRVTAADPAVVIVRRVFTARAQRGAVDAVDLRVDAGAWVS